MSALLTETNQPGRQATTMIAAPTAASERIEVLDVLRGCALYGVLLANTVPWFSGQAFTPRTQHLAQSDAIDRVFFFLLNVLIDSKAMTLLTFLFGLGFSLQLKRAESGGRSVVPTYLRRLAALAFIGICHVLLLWWGDILWGYAIAGLGLLFFRKMRGKKLLFWGIGLAILPELLAAIPGIAKALAPIQPTPADLAGFRAQVLAAITGHNRRLLTVMQVKQVYYFVGRFWVAYFPGLLGRFLIGYWAGTTGLFQQAAQRLSFFRKLAIFGLGFGLAGSLLMTILSLLDRQMSQFSEIFWALMHAPGALATMLLTCGYAAAVVLLMQRPTFRRALLIIAPVGQMALSTYIMQSLFCTFLFYGWGLGLAPRIQSARLFPITFLIFAVQILFARIWLSRFRFGPLEWLWRSMTYGRLQPISRR